MTLLPNERAIPLAVQAITLTTHRLRLLAERGGEFTVTSMMLDELASCAALKREFSVLLYLAAIVAGLGITLSVLSGGAGPGPAVAGCLIGLVILLFYLVTRRTVLVFASSGGARIEIVTGNLERGVIVDVIDTVEQAKDQRARSLVAGNSASATTRNGKPENLPPGRSAASRPEPAVSRVPAGRGLVHYFYVDLDGQVAGPVTTGEIKRLVGDGIVSTDAQVCAEGSEQWQPLAAVVTL